MLKEEVIEAVRNSQFHIWPIKTIDEGIELLTGVLAGEPDGEGTYPENTVHGRVDRNLRMFAEKLKEYQVPEEREAEKRE